MTNANRKCLVTGGSGFIGRHLVTALQARGYAVRMVTRREPAVATASAEVVRADLTAADCPFEDLLADCTTVFHCAGEVRDPRMMRALHVDGTRRLLEAAVSASERHRPIHWVQLSSCGVYGPPIGRPDAKRVVTEETAMRPVGLYEITKAASDELLMAEGSTRAFSYTIVRPSNVFATDMPNGSLRALGEVIRRRLFFYVGQPDAVATYVHVNDVINALIQCGIDDRARGRVLNLSNDCLLSEMINGMAFALGVARPRLRLPQPLVRAAVGALSAVMRVPLTQARIDALVRRTHFPHSRLCYELGLVPRVSVPGAIGEVLVERQ